ncbi:WD-40 repeat-containing protein [Nitzschia inconspicua]|uniref:WD-40 repeat-containing protein n=1 Tax=Nitzschia inconspicua TaxID=303405 RepID=A0A9K3KV90_9STRA|nr:WD-40 repeat-containing protein [Nitzschia inconspicua]
MSSSGHPKGTSIAGEAEPPVSSNNNQQHQQEDMNLKSGTEESVEEDAVSTSDQPITMVQDRSPNNSHPVLHLTSDEVNYLVFRYMQESGFTHSAFTFVYESMLGRSSIRSSEKLIPPGALVSFLQKGLQYVGIEETLHLEQEQAAAGKKVKAGITSATGNHATSVPPHTDISNLSLLSPITLNAMTRENPPLQLNVPPATAAAAIKARLEAEAQIEADRKQAAITEAQQRLQANGANGRMIGPNSIPPQPSLMATNPLSNAAMEVQAAQAAMSQLQQQQQHQHAAVQAQQLQSNDNGAAALIAQQRRAVAEMAALEEHRQAQLVQQQLQIQQQLQQEQLQQLHQETLAAHAQSSAGHSTDAATALASVADRLGTNSKSIISSSSSNNNVSGVKRPLSAKKGLKNKGKPSKQQKTAASQQPEAEPASATNPHSGFASLEEAVARLEQQRQQQEQQQQSQDVTMTDAAEAIEEQLFQRQLQHQNASELLNKISSSHRGELSSQQAAAVQDLIRMNGERFNNDGQAQLVSNGPLLTEVTHSNLASIPPGGAAAVIAASHLPPKEAAKAADAMIDKEDELTNANSSQVLELKMHQSEVFMCAWNSVFTDIIATGSGDASARIWQMGGAKASDGLGPVRLLPHGSGPKDRKNKDVTTLEWSSDGKFLATGSYDGVARVWSLNGSLVHTLRGHKGPIFSLKWNKMGNFLLSGSYDKTTIVWDVSTPNGFVEQQFHDHQAPALDVDWKDDTTFASCSTDKTVHICRVGSPRPLKKYTGHTDEVNAVKWDPSGRLLASCSDDCTAKVWDVNSERKDPLFNFKSHQQEIYTVKWAPTGPGSNNPEKLPMLATASFDGSVRLWNIRDGSCVQVFSRHRDSVYSVAFSPSGDFLASGSLAGQLYIWNVLEGRHIKSFKGKGDIFEVAWNKEETRVAACFSSNVVCIIDFP